MSSQVKYSDMSYQELADYVILRGPRAPLEGVIELIQRGPTYSDYLLRYIKDDYYWSSDSFEDKMVPAVAIVILACSKRRDLWDQIFAYVSDSYDFLMDIFDIFNLSILSDLLPVDIFRVKGLLKTGNIHRFLLFDIIEAYELMSGRGLVPRPVLVEFLKDGIQSRTNMDLCSMCIWVALDIGAGELKPYIDDAFRENRVDLRTIAQDDIIFRTDPSGIHKYRDPLQFFEPSNLEKLSEYVDLEPEASDLLHSIYDNTGVNDPCPCNSGKKFKKCCRPLILEREKFVELEGRVWEHLDKCKYSDPYKHYVEDAFQLFTAAIPGNITDNSDVFLTWAIHDYIIPGKNRSLLSLYLQEHSSTIREDERNVLSDLMYSNFVVVEVERIVPYLGFHVLQVFPQKEHYFITDTLSTSYIANHSLLLLRLYKIGTLNRIGGGALKIPYSEINYFQDLSNDFMNKYVSENPPEKRNKFTMSQYISRNSLSLIAAAYERSRMKLFPDIVSAEGDPVVFHSSSYQIYDLPYVVKTLKQDSRFDFSPDSVGTFIWKGPIDGEKQSTLDAMGASRIYGTIRLSDHSITVECFTQKRWMICVDLLRSILGEKMGSEIIKSETEIADAIKDTPHIRDSDQLPKSPEMRKIEQDLIDSYYMKWLDEEIPALEGKTPREAARDPMLRQKLIFLLNELESTSTPVSNIPKAPIERMKHELGL